MTAMSTQTIFTHTSTYTHKHTHVQAVMRLEKDLENMLLKLGMLELYVPLTQSITQHWDTALAQHCIAHERPSRYEGVFLEEDVRLDDLLNFSPEEVGELIPDEMDRSRLAAHLVAYRLAMQRQERDTERRAQPISFRSEADLAAAKQHDDVKRAANAALTRYLADSGHSRAKVSLPERRRYLEHYEREMLLLVTDPDKTFAIDAEGGVGGFPSVPPPTHLDEYGRTRPGSGQLSSPPRLMQSPAAARQQAARRVNKHLRDGRTGKGADKAIVNPGRAPISSGYGPSMKPTRFKVKTNAKASKVVIKSHPDLKIHDETVSGFTMVYRQGSLRPLFMMSEF
jgi:hypothetical protein